jgi:hypothetical protein
MEQNFTFDIWAGFGLVLGKACNESWEAQLTRSDSWALTAWILLKKVLFFSNKRARLQLQVM